jgi:peroxiredoxin
MPALTRLVLKLLITATVVVPGVPSSERLRSARHLASSVGDDSEKPDYAPIVERKLDFYDFTYKTADERSLNLREYAGGKSVIIVEYFAGWCANSNRNGHVIERLWAKYRERGLGVIGVAEYSNADELRIHINRIGIEYPIVIETTKRTDRKNSFHFKYRRAAGDKRKWGTPFYVIIDARDVEPIAGKAPLARRVFTVSGELVESEAEQFIEPKLTRGVAR